MKKKSQASEKVPHTIMNLDGVAAVFVRGHMEKYYSGETGLRECQEAGVQAISDLGGGSISTSYISKLSRMLRDAKIVSSDKRGRKYYLMPSVFTEEFKAFLDADGVWGTVVVGSTSDVHAKTAYIKHMRKYGCVKSTAEHRLPKAAYKQAMEAVHEGTLDLVFVPAGAKVVTRVDGERVEVQELEQNG